MEAIILAGGFGTRLRSVVSDVPKPMAPVAGRPFLALLIEHLRRRGFKRVILAVGYLHERIEEYFEAHPPSLEMQYSIETLPLGTGGAVKLAMRQAAEDEVFVLNGDTFVPLDYAGMRASHARHAAAITMALAPVDDSARFGSVDLDGEGRIRAFREKSVIGSSLVNAGVYLVNAGWAANAWPDGAFSLEGDLLRKEVQTVPMYGFPAAGGFLDIGTPQSYADAERFVELMLS